MGFKEFKAADADGVIKPNDDAMGFYVSEVYFGLALITTTDSDSNNSRSGGSSSGTRLIIEEDDEDFIKLQDAIN